MIKMPNIYIFGKRIGYDLEGNRPVTFKIIS